MAGRGKGHYLFIGVGVICLIASAIIFWDVVRDGFTVKGMLSPGAFALIGLFWLLWGLKAGGTQKSSGSNDAGEG